MAKQPLTTGPSGPPTPFNMNRVMGVQGPQGPPGTSGSAGATGAAGQAAFTTTTSSFTQPAIGSTVSVPVGNSSWAGVGEALFLVGGGYYTVSSIPDTLHIVLTNTGATGNASVGATVSSGGLVTPGGSNGINAYTVTTASFVMPAASGNVTISVQQNAWMAVGQPLFIATAGFFVVQSIGSGSIVAQNTGAGGNATPGTTISSGSAVVPSGQPAGFSTAGTGLIQVNSGSVSVLADGTRSQQLMMIGSTPARTWSTVTGDITFLDAAATVGGILGKTLPALPSSDKYLHYTGSAWAFSTLGSGTANANLSFEGQFIQLAAAGSGNGLLSWPKTQATPTISQDTQTTDTATNNITIRAQAPFASAVTNTKPGHIIFELPTDVAGNDASYVKFLGDASFAASVSIGGAVGTNDGYGRIWFSVTTPTSGNMSIYGVGGSQLFLQAGANSSVTLQNGTTNTWYAYYGMSIQAQTNNIAFQVGGADQLYVEGSGVFNWNKSVTTPTLGQDTPTSDVATNDFIIAPQASYASATGSNRTGANLVLKTAAATNSGTGSPFVRLKQGTVYYASFGNLSNGSGSGSIWLSSSQVGAETGSNYFASADGSNTFVNGPSTLFLGTNGGTAVCIHDADGVGIVTIGSRFTGAENPLASLSFSKTLTNATILHNPQTTDVATNPLIIKAQSAWASAPTHTSGGALLLEGGSATDGSIGGTISLAGAANGSAGDIEFRVGGTNQALFNGTALKMFAQIITFDQATTSFNITCGQKTSDTATNTFLIQGQNAYTSASINTSGGHLKLQSGAAKDTSHAAGDITFYIGATSVLTLTAGTGGEAGGVYKLRWADLSANTASLYIDVATPTADNVASDLYLIAGAAFGSASVNKQGGHLFLQAGLSQSGFIGGQIQLDGGSASASGAVTISGSNIYMEGPVGGNGTTFTWRTNTFSIAGSGTKTPGSAVYSCPFITLTGALTGAVTVAWPNQAGFWLVDLSGVTSISGTNTVTFSSGSATKVVANAALPVGTLVTVVTNGSNTIYVSAPQL